MFKIKYYLCNDYNLIIMLRLRPGLLLMKTLPQIANELQVKPASLRTKLYRWQKAGKVHGSISSSEPLDESVVIRIYELCRAVPSDQESSNTIAPAEAEKPAEPKSDGFTDYRAMAKQVRAKKQQPVADEAEVVEPVTVTDFGRKSLTNPNVRFATAIVPIAAQAAIYTALSARVYDIQNDYMTAGVFVVGLLFEAVGLMLAMSLPKSQQVSVAGEYYSARSLWLVTFFMMQIIIDFAFIGLLGSWSDAIGRVVIGVSVPVTILAYNNLYLKD